MIPKLYLYGIAAAVGAGLISGIWLHGNYHGKLSCNEQVTEASNDQRDKQSERADEVEERSEQRQQKTGVQVRYVYSELDPTGCADVKATDGVLNGLRSGQD